LSSNDERCTKHVGVESEIRISVCNIRQYAKTATLVVKTTTVDIARTI